MGIAVAENGIGHAWCSLIQLGNSLLSELCAACLARMSASGGSSSEEDITADTALRAVHMSRTNQVNMKDTD